MKTDILYIDGSKFLAVLADLAVPHTLQSGFIRVDGPKGRRMYIAATKRVGRIDLSGFEVDFGAKVPHCGIFGNVRQQLDLDPVIGEEGILSNFRTAVELMLSLEPVVKVKAAAKPKAPKAKKAGTTGPVPAAPAAPETAEAKAKRMELIKRVAAAKGVGVSRKSIAQADVSGEDADTALVINA